MFPGYVFARLVDRGPRRGCDVAIPVVNRL